MTIKTERDIAARMHARLSHRKQYECEAMVSEIVKALADKLADDNVIYIDGFGTFKLKYEAAREINVSLHPGVTGAEREVRTIGARRLPVFDITRPLYDQLKEA